MLLEEISKEYPSYVWRGYAGICPVCGEVLVSLYPNEKPNIEHDYATCKCRSVMIDAGHDDSLRIGGDLIKIGIITKRSKFDIITPSETIHAKNFKSLRTLYKGAFCRNNNSAKDISVIALA